MVDCENEPQRTTKLILIFLGSCCSLSLQPTLSPFGLPITCLGWAHHLSTSGRWLGSTTSCREIHFRCSTPTPFIRTQEASPSPNISSCLLSWPRLARGYRKPRSSAQCRRALELGARRLGHVPSLPRAHGKRDRILRGRVDLRVSHLEHQRAHPNPDIVEPVVPLPPTGADTLFSQPVDAALSCGRRRIRTARFELHVLGSLPPIGGRAGTDSPSVASPTGMAGALLFSGFHSAWRYL